MSNHGEAQLKFHNLSLQEGLNLKETDDFYFCYGLGKTAEMELNALISAVTLSVPEAGSPESEILQLVE